MGGVVCGKLELQDREVNARDCTERECAFDGQLIAVEVRRKMAGVG